MRIGLRADEIRPVRRRKTRKASPRTKAPTRQPDGIACFDFRLAGADVVILDRETRLLEPGFLAAHPVENRSARSYPTHLQNNQSQRKQCASKRRAGVFPWRRTALTRRESVLERSTFSAVPNFPRRSEKREKMEPVPGAERGCQPANNLGWPGTISFRWLRLFAQEIPRVFVGVSSTSFFWR